MSRGLSQCCGACPEFTRFDRDYRGDGDVSPDRSPDYMACSRVIGRVNCPALHQMSRKLLKYRSKAGEFQASPGRRGGALEARPRRAGRAT